MSARRQLTSLFRVKRPVLRVQLTLLYSGLFLGLLAAVLFATNVLYGHSSAQAPEGAPHAVGNASRNFDVGPALLALAAAVIALAGAWWLAGRFLRPLSAITAAAQEISATNLNRRLGLTGPNDELTRLGHTLDGLFGRLESSFESQRRFVANASHELRTPLAGQRTLLQVIRIGTDLVAAPAAGDPRLVELLVTNLVDNALRHNAADGQVDVSCRAAQGRAAITVANSGPVVPADQIAELFQPFHHPAGRRRGRTDGHGLGLAIVHAVAHAHAAEIDARPRPDGGLEITVTFPAADRETDSPG
jgi:signal transduction histidine kinase